VPPDLDADVLSRASLSSELRLVHGLEERPDLGLFGLGGGWRVAPTLDVRVAWGMGNALRDPARGWGWRRVR
jgi:hypothetical protein